MIVFSLSLLLSIFIIVTVIFYWVTYNKLIDDNKVYPLQPIHDEDTSIGYFYIKNDKNYSMDTTSLTYKNNVQNINFQDE